MHTNNNNNNIKYTKYKSILLPMHVYAVRTMTTTAGEISACMSVGTAAAAFNVCNLNSTNKFSLMAHETTRIHLSLYTYTSNQFAFLPCCLVGRGGAAAAAGERSYFVPFLYSRCEKENELETPSASTHTRQ